MDASRPSSHWGGGELAGIGVPDLATVAPVDALQSDQPVVVGRCRLSGTNEVALQLPKLSGR
jgi:hypothetical protein